MNAPLDHGPGNGTGPSVGAPEPAGHNIATQSIDPAAVALLRASLRELANGYLRCRERSTRESAFALLSALDAREGRQ